MKPLVSIISVNFNSLDVTVEMIASIQKNSYQNVEVIIVDNASEVCPENYLNQNFPEVKLIQSSQNLGFAGGNNLGIQQAKGEYIICLNNDAELTNGVIEKLIKAFDEIPNLGLISPMICFQNKIQEDDNQDVIQYAGATSVHYLTGRNKTLGRLEKESGQYSKRTSTAYVHGAAMMVKKSILEKTGLMSEAFFLYYEELDWCEQFKRLGYEIFVDPTVKIYHKESYSVGKISTLRTFYLNRNRILFMRRNRQDWQVAVFCLFLILVVLPKNSIQFLLKRDFKNLNAFWRSLWWNLKDRFKNNRRINSLKKNKQLHQSPELVGATT